MVPAGSKCFALQAIQAVQWWCAWVAPSLKCLAKYFQKTIFFSNYFQLKSQRKPIEIDDLHILISHENLHRCDVIPWWYFLVGWNFRMIVNPSKGCPTMSKHPRMLEGSPLNMFSFLSKRLQWTGLLVNDLNLLDKLMVWKCHLIPRRLARSLSRRICLFWGF